MDMAVKNMPVLDVEKNTNDEASMNARKTAEVHQVYIRLPLSSVGSPATLFSYLAKHLRAF